MPEDHTSNPDPQQRQNPAPSDNPDPIRSVGQSEADDEKATDQNKRPHWADRTIAVFTVLIFFTYLTSDYFLWRQLGTTRDALKQAKDDNAASITAQKEIAQSALAKSQDNFVKSSEESSKQFAKVLGQMEAQSDAQDKSAKATGAAARAATTQAEASLRSAKAQEVANGIVTRQYEMSQAAQMDMIGVSVEESKDGGHQQANFSISNIGSTEARNVVIQGRSYFFGNREVVESMHFDPTTELGKFRDNPQEQRADMRSQIAYWINHFQTIGETEHAQHIRELAERNDLLSAPKRVSRIPRGTGVVQTYDGGQRAKGTLHYVLMIIDWDDIFKIHHTNDMCYLIIDGTTTSFCTNPVEYQPPKDQTPKK